MGADEFSRFSEAMDRNYNNEAENKQYSSLCGGVCTMCV